METFDRIYLLDLHGNAKKRERTPDGLKDENVFDIQQGVVIGLFVKCMNTNSKDNDEDNDKQTKVYHADLWVSARMIQTAANMVGLQVTMSRLPSGLC